MESHLPKLAKPHFYMIYYRIIIYLLSNAVYMVNFGRACNHAALGEPSSHAEREPIWNDLRLFFLYKFGCDCAPNEANYVCTSQLSDLLTLKVYQYKEICITYTLKKCSHSPTEACKTTFYKIYYFRTIIPNAVFWSEHRKGVLAHRVRWAAISREAWIYIEYFVIK